LTQKLQPAVFAKDPSARPSVTGSYPLLCHLLDTAAVAGLLWDQRVRPALRARLCQILDCDNDTGRSLLQLAAGLHDIGKANPFFQYQQRRGAENGYAAELAAELGFPEHRDFLDVLNGLWRHPLRRHEFVSFRGVTGEWATGDTRIASERWIAMIAGGHHGYWRSTSQDETGWEREGADEFLSGGWADEQRELRTRVHEALGNVEVPNLDGEHAAAVFGCFSGLVTLADWLASDDAYVASGKLHYEAVAGGEGDPFASAAEASQWLSARAELARDHLAGLLGAQADYTREALEEATLGDFAPRPLQAEAKAGFGDEDAGLWICTYPTGDGKTEAALLRHAHAPEEGLFFGLPTMATTDAMESRLATVSSRVGVDKLPLIKSHSMADLFGAADVASRGLASVYEGDECDQAGGPGKSAYSAWYSTGIRKLLAPNVVGTIDQALSGALSQRHILLRLFGLANHHVVLDEIHTFDPYQTSLLLQLLTWWGATHTRVTLLSATLPAGHMQMMLEAYVAGVEPQSKRAFPETTIPFPGTLFLAARPDAEPQIREPNGPVRQPQPTRMRPVLVATRAARVDSHVEWATKTAHSYQDSSIAVIVNTVDDCAEIAGRLAAAVPTHDVLCLHSRLMSVHRKAVEERLLERAGKTAHIAGFDHRDPARRPVIVVGTQVIQASLDFDVDFMASDLAPAPDLIQRLGRSWRFEGAPGVPSREVRIPGQARSLRIIGVGSQDRVVPGAARPYLTAVLQRTYDALSVHLLRTNGGAVDLMAFSQEWVDAAYNQDPEALLNEEQPDGQRAALDEAQDIYAKKRSAGMSVARIREDLFAPPGRRNRQTGGRWKDLVQLTHRNDDEDLMRTRYIESETLHVLLFDSRLDGALEYLDRSGELAQIKLLDGAALAASRDGRHVYTGLESSLPIGSRATPAAKSAVARTLGMKDWEAVLKSWRPEAPILRSRYPLDLAHLPEYRYDPITGLRPIKEQS